MAIQSAVVAVSTTAAELTQVRDEPSSILITAPAAAVLYIGDSAVTSVNGYPLAAGASVSLDLETKERVYGVLASGTGNANVLRTGI
jgi:hypothetical protein